jgi:hypothetical protein
MFIFDFSFLHMKIFFCVFLLVFHAGFLAGQNSKTEGIYYLEGVMETASGIKLNTDGTFEFFFSQGALDRTGKGKWISKDDQVILQSQGEMPKGFVLMKSEKEGNKKASVTVKENNTMLLSYIHVKFTGEKESEPKKLDESGTAVSADKDVTKITLYFELCPERTYEFLPMQKGDNIFEFSIDPSIFEIYFDNVILKSGDNTLTGKHPLLRGDAYTFRKE